MAKLDKKKPTTKTKRARSSSAKPAKLKPSKAKTVKTKPGRAITLLPPPPLALDPSAAVLDRLWGVVRSRRNADPAISHSARLLSRGTAKVAQKFGEEAVECLIEAVSGTHEGLIAESADVLYHLLVMWVDADLRPEDVWAELQRREGISGIAEKAARAKPKPLAHRSGSRKIP